MTSHSSKQTATRRPPIIKGVKLNAGALKEYKDANGSVCPTCKSENLFFGAASLSATGSDAIIHCQDCNERWMEIHETVKVILLREGDKQTPDRKGKADMDTLMNRNIIDESQAYNYMLEPGNATRYRFSLMFLNDYSASDAMVISDGLGTNAHEYVWLAINMPMGCGVGVINLEQMRNLESHYISYLKTHGFDSVTPHTLVACLSALRVLVEDPWNVADAAKAVMEADYEGLLWSMR